MTKPEVSPPHGAGAPPRWGVGAGTRHQSQAGQGVPEMLGRAYTISKGQRLPAEYPTITGKAGDGAHSNEREDEGMGRALLKSLLPPPQVSFPPFQTLRQPVHSLPPPRHNQNVPGSLLFYFEMRNLARLVPVSCPNVPIFKASGYTVPHGTNTSPQSSPGSNESSIYSFIPPVFVYHLL